MLLAWGPAALRNVRTSTATTPLDVLYPDAMESRKNRVRLDGQPPRPNILLITADDFPRAALHAYGLPRRYDVAPGLVLKFLWLSAHKAIDQAPDKKTESVSFISAHQSRLC